MISRRTFLAQAGAATLFAFPLDLPLGFQSFDLNGPLRDDFKGTLRRVAGLGYTWIDYVWTGGTMSAKEVRQAFDDAGLACPNCHYSWKALHEDYAATIEIAHTLGNKTLICQSNGANTKTADGWKWHADGLAELSLKTKKDGILTGYHNHPGELREVEGKLPLEILAAGTDASLVKFQLDLGAVVIAGHDALATMNKYQGRLFSIHVKDVKDGRSGIAVGEGTLDWPAIFASARKQGLMNYAVETGARGDIAWEKLKSSLEYLRAMKV